MIRYFYDFFGSDDDEGDVQLIIDALRGFITKLAAPPGDDCLACAPTDTATRTLTVDHQIYLVTFRVRGLTESKTITGGETLGGHTNVGGAPAADTWNIHSLTISAPPSVIYLNAGTETTCGEINLTAQDYTFNVQMLGTALLTLLADSVDSVTNSNATRQIPSDAPAFPIMVAQPYVGTFLQVDAITVAVSGYRADSLGVTADSTLFTADYAR